MALYQYVCDDDGPFEASSPIGTAAPRRPCPACSAEARRVYTAPMLSRASRPAMAVLERAERSAHEPDVVTSLPPGGRRRPAAARPSPAQRRLPRS